MTDKEIDKLNENLKKSADDLEQSLKQNHITLEANFNSYRTSVIQNLKSYLINISLISATIIPFSSLVFQIPAKFVTPNFFIWLLSLLLFIISLGIFLFCFLKIIDAERNSYTKLLIDYLESGLVDGISLQNESLNNKVNSLLKISGSQSRFYLNLKNSFGEETFVNLIDYIKFSSWVFISGLGLFFLSILFPKMVDYFC